MATLTIRPNAAGNQNGWNAEGGDYTRVDEAVSDGDTTRLYSPTNNAVSTFNLDNHTTENGGINSVTVYINTRGLDPISNVVQLALRTGGTDYFSSNKTYNNTSYHLESNTWSTNPNTSAAWTWSEIDALEAGMKRISGGGQAVTQVYVVVDYTPSTLEQEGFRFRNDDGSETTATWKASQDTNINQAKSVNIRLRLLINSTGQADANKYYLQFKKTTDSTWVDIDTDTSKAISLSASSNITASGENTTAQLTAPTGKTTADFHTGRMQDDENPADDITIGADKYTELEWSLIVNTSATDNGTYEFRVVRYQAISYTSELTTGGTASASRENQPSEGSDEAFDGTTTTKWLVLNGAVPEWLQYRFGSGAKHKVVKYAVSSANDDATRDPKNWTLQGSNDGTNWTTVDTRTNEAFASRQQRKEYICDSPSSTAFEYYRIYITANNGATGTYYLQLSELELYAYLEEKFVLDTYTVTPQLTVTTASSSQIKKLLGISQASIKKASSVAIASVKKVAGVSN